MMHLSALLGLSGLAFPAVLAATPSVDDEVGLLQTVRQVDEEFSAPKWFLLQPEVALAASVIDAAAPTKTLTAKALRADASFLSVQEAWQHKFGPNPSFMIQPIDYHGHLPQFNYMFPKGEQDQWQVEEQAVLEPFVSYNLVKDLKACCAGGGRFVDVGGNMGWYTLMMASLGCHVDVFEPVPWFSSLMGFNSASINEAGVGERITAHFGKILGGSVGPRRTMVVPTKGLTGAASVDGANARGTTSCGTEKAACFGVGMTTLDNELASSMNGQTECGMKIDVEGYEPDVISGAQAFLPASLPKVIVIELSPGMQKGHGRDQTNNLKMLHLFKHLGYAPHLLDWGLIKNKDYDAIRGTSMASRKFHGSAEDLIKKCKFNCMVYFTRQ